MFGAVSSDPLCRKRVGVSRDVVLQREAAVFWWFSSESISIAGVRCCGSTFASGCQQRSSRLPTPLLVHLSFSLLSLVNSSDSVCVPPLSGPSDSESEPGGEPHSLPDHGRGGVDVRSRGVRALWQRGDGGPADPGASGGLRGAHHRRCASEWARVHVEAKKGS